MSAPLELSIEETGQLLYCLLLREDELRDKLLRGVIRPSVARLELGECAALRAKLSQASAGAPS